MRIPLAKPMIGTAEQHALLEVLKSGWLAQGSRVEQFERQIARYVGARHAVATSSGTTALHLALLLAGVEPGDDVLVPSYSFIATTNAVFYVGARPVLCDVDRKTYNFDPTELAARVTPKTKAMVVVDQVGLPAELETFESFARDHGIKLVEDAACALGAKYKGTPTGAGAEIATFSFHPRKCVTTGEGGALVTSNDALAQRARRLRNHGADASGAYTEIGYNYRMTDIAAALGGVQLERLDEIIQSRRSLAARYARRLACVDGLHLPGDSPNGRATFQSYLIAVHERLGDAARIVRRLRDKGIGAGIGIRPSHLEPHVVSRCGEASLPNTEWLARQALFLPIFPEMAPEQVDEVASALAEICSDRAS